MDGWMNIFIKLKVGTGSGGGSCVSVLKVYNQPFFPSCPHVEQKRKVPRVYLLETISFPPQVDPGDTIVYKTRQTSGLPSSPLSGASPLLCGSFPSNFKPLALPSVLSKLPTAGKGICLLIH